MVECSFKNYFAPASSKEFLAIQATIECGFTLKRVRDMTRTYSHSGISIVYFEQVHIGLGNSYQPSVPGGW